jgi:DNA-damage-inducible protein D
MQFGDETTSISLFEQQPIRRIWHDGRWFYSIIDIVAVLVQNTNPRRYWSDLKRKLKAQGFAQLYEKTVQLKLPAPDGKQYETDCADIETLLRIIQSIPSPKAEPFKQWLAQIGAEIIDDRTEDQKRLHNSNQAIAMKKRLHGEIHVRGVRTPSAHAAFEARGHAQLYGGESLAESKARKGLDETEDIGEWMNSEEIADTLFRDAQSHAYIRRMDIKGREPVIEAHEQVSKKVREFIIEDLGGIPPEHLPTPNKSLSQAQKDEERRRIKGMDLWPELPDPEK